MKVFVTGATGVLGCAAVTSLVADGHDVHGIARDDTKAAALEAAGAVPVQAQLLEVDAMTAAFDGFDAVCNLATHVPVGVAGLRPGAWKVNDRLRVQGSRVVAQAARAAGVRRLVQESVSFVYADGGDDWITEESTVAVTRGTDPAAVAEDNASRFASTCRQAVILRLGSFVGDDPMTRWRLYQAKLGRAVSFGDPLGWTHLVHTDDAGAAVAAALAAPSGVYNVGAEPVRRDAVSQVFAEAVGRASLGTVPKLMVRLGGERLAPLARSHRVCSAKIHEMTGWKPEHDVFDQSWLPHPTSG
ncbi:MAG: NAD(P)-dependent oxidoreductase [Nocardioidaceae bacterium]|nr:NAD(P)-dependent oxidoreductase [Nocardioidaceae bacterium]